MNVRMTRANSKDFAANVANRQTILLLGDDGRMAQLLRRRFRQYRLLCIDNALEGIVQLDESAFDLVLLNAEGTADKTADAVKALRLVKPETRVAVYGEPFAEPFAQTALKAGADDYLVWPVPAEELRRLLETKTKPPSSLPKADLNAAASADSISDRNLLEKPSRAAAEMFQRGGLDILQQYRQLAQLIPKGKEILIQRAQKVLADALGAEWVSIHLSESNNGFPTPSSESTDEPPGCVVTMRGPMGPAGEMRLGPTRYNELNHLNLAQQAADYMGTLLHLIDRDESLKRLATIDELTGAYNRRYLEYFLRQMIEQSKYEHTEVTLLIFDIDNFKHYNDTYGHSAGDNILRQATRLMRRCCRSHDVVARMGGDEFAVLFWDTHRRRKVYKHEGDEAVGTPELEMLRQPPAGDRITRGDPASGDEQASQGASRKSHAELAVFMSNRFRRMMNKSEFPGLGPEARGMLTISGGLAHFPLDSSGVVDLLARADEALLTAKRSGKNRLYLVGRPGEPAG